MNRYLVKLKPIEHAFLGGEQTFNQGDQTNYLVRSRWLPQQTRILGFIRHQLLIQNGAMPLRKNRKVAKMLIGPESFCLDKKDQQFGAIESISPLFIVDELENYYFPVGLAQNEDKNVPSLTLAKSDEHYHLKHYDPKKEYALAFRKQGCETLKYLDDILIEDRRDGNRKEYDGESKEDGFYVQYCFRMKHGYAFGFEVVLGENANLNSRNLVIFGGERSKYTMEVVPIKKDDKTWKDRLPDHLNEIADKAVLLSDAFVSEHYDKDLEFCHTQTCTFRSLYSAVEHVESWHDLDQSGKGKTKRKRSGKFRLLARGSTLYGNAKKLKNVLHKESLCQIGFNHYQFIKKTIQ